MADRPLPTSMQAATDATQCVRLIGMACGLKDIGELVSWLNHARLVGLDINTRLPDQSTALLRSCAKGFSVGVRLLLKEKAEISSMPDGRTAIFLAVQSGDADTAAALLQNDDPEIAAGAQRLAGTVDVDGDAPMHYANPACIELLHNARADINPFNKVGCTPLFHASRDGRLDRVAKLLECNAPASGAKNLQELCCHNCQPNRYATPLGVAYANHHSGIAKALISARASPHWEDKCGTGDMDLPVAAYNAVLSDDIKGVVGWLAQGGSVHAMLTDEERRAGCTLLHAAAASGSVEITRILLQRKADVDVQDLEYSTPLQIAACQFNFPVVELLLKAGANTKLRSEDGKGLTIVELLRSNDIGFDPGLEDGRAAMVNLIRRHEPASQHPREPLSATLSTADGLNAMLGAVDAEIAAQLAADELLAEEERAREREATSLAKRRAKAKKKKKGKAPDGVEASAAASETECGVVVGGRGRTSTASGEGGDAVGGDGGDGAAAGGGGAVSGGDLAASGSNGATSGDDCAASGGGGDGELKPLVHELGLVRLDTPGPSAQSFERPQTPLASAEVADPDPQVENVPLTLADVGNITGREDAPPSTIGGQTTCIVCFTNPKTHLAVPCGHQCACSDCAAKMKRCPYCNGEAAMWIEVRVA